MNLIQRWRNRRRIRRYMARWTEALINNERENRPQAKFTAWGNAKEYHERER